MEISNENMHFHIRAKRVKVHQHGGNDITCMHPIVAMVSISHTIAVHMK